MIETESLAQTWNATQIVKFLKFQVGIKSRSMNFSNVQEVLKAIPLDNLSGAVSAYHQSSSEPVVLDNVEITNAIT